MVALKETKVQGLVLKEGK